MVADGENANGDNGGTENGDHKKVKPPFQLCFASTQEQGRSELSKPKLPRHASFITPKFYSNIQHVISPEDPIIKELTHEIETIRSAGPRDKYDEPVLESHCYGWCPEPLLPMDKYNRLYNHHRLTSDMVKVQCILLNASKAEKQFHKLILNKAKQE